MGYTQRYDFVALYKKEHWKYNYFLNHEQYKVTSCKYQDSVLLWMKEYTDIRALYPSTLDDIDEKVTQEI